jgi:hypothetical protein
MATGLRFCGLLTSPLVPQKEIRRTKKHLYVEEEFGKLILGLESRIKERMEAHEKEM